MCFCPKRNCIPSLHVKFEFVTCCILNIVLQVPYELLNKKFRAAQKCIDREVTKVQGAGTDLETCLQQPEMVISEVTEALDNMVEKLKMLKRKV